MDFSNYLANKLISATVRNTSYPAPRNVYLALFKTDPTKNNIGIEVTGDLTQDLKLHLLCQQMAVSQNSAQITYAVATTNWGEVGWVGIMDSQEDGNLLYFTELENHKNILTGDQLKFKLNEITLTLT